LVACLKENREHPRQRSGRTGGIGAHGRCNLMSYENVLEHLLQRHRAFWAMEEVETPLLSVGRYSPLEDRRPFQLANGSPVQEGNRLLPELVDAQRLVEHTGKPSITVNGDFIRGSAPYDLCWTEAVAGCPIVWWTGQVWTESFWDNLDNVEQLCVTPDNLWLKKLLEITHLLVEQAKQRYPVCQPLLRGPIDLASAVLGDEQICWSVMDKPERFKQLLEVCTDIFVDVAKFCEAISPSFKGGYCIYGIWAPGTVVRMQGDNAVLLSPRLYQDFLVPCDECICDQFDYPLIHTHSGFIEMIADALLGNRKLRAIQVSLDYPAGPSITDLLPTLQKINAGKSLIITGGLMKDELNLLLETLSPRGLCLQVGIHD